MAFIIHLFNKNLILKNQTQSEDVICYVTCVTLSSCDFTKRFTLSAKNENY
jgi:hypothetical protein